MAPLPVKYAAMFKKLLAARGFHTTAGRFWWSQPGLWIDDHRSRPWPKTEEERKAAAVRYGLRDGDYKPVKEDYFYGIGDYPDLGELGYTIKDPYENWTYYKYRRNFGEPMPWNQDMYGPDKVSYTGVEPESAWGVIWKYVLHYAALGLLVYVTFEFPVRTVIAQKPKQYPYDYNYAYPTYDPKLFPLTNYTFEPADNEEAEPKKDKNKGHH